ncbi:Galactose/methyl galactoside import ATP-binding protein MglA [Poriferisphaera corsica]|uniref:Galactose/methyl galactoside import ATP-binding protein MglA n=1 Tax=Poriferisphaera corsica TaxID=2528020 RepID=A0A517YT29_9BACT|nr:sugar ABC transporter ATP-binding protein [Poriferisphaera corsica]QDU33380.1 Galactose/methyl galactoside import ATP-binding protein MglA [Poriferisphaera corsica]
MNQPVPRLKIENAIKHFGQTIALDGVDLELMPGEIHAIIGENGAGKSTLMKALSGAHKLDTGKMWLDGQSYKPLSPHDGRSSGVSMIYQELSLAQHLSVKENILLGVEPNYRGLINWPKVKRQANQALEGVGRPDINLDLPVMELSNAEQQLVEIARSLATGCKVLVLDEPTSSLTQSDTQKLFSMMRTLKKQGVSILYISHFLEEVKEVCDNFTVLRDGVSVGNGSVAETSTDEIVSMMVGRDVKQMYPKSKHDVDEVVLTVRSLQGEHRKPEEVSFELHRGEVLGIAGVVGAGRTEMLRAIFSLDEIKKGDVKVAGFIGHASPSARWLHGVGMVSEDRKFEGLATGLSIADNIVMSSMKNLGPLGFITRRGLLKASKPWIEKIPIKCADAFAAVDSLSGGNQQKVAIARLLHADVDVMLLDEPTRGIDVGSKAAIYEMIDQLACGKYDGDGRKRAVLIVSSYLPELLGICDRIAVMCRGQLGPAKPISECNELQIMREATGTGDKTGDNS